MAQVDSKNTTAAPVDQTRRRFLSQAAGVAAGSAALALATIPPALAANAPAGTLDPVFRLIEAHRTAWATWLAALAEHIRLENLGDPDADLASEVPCCAANDAFYELIDTAPTTFAGLQAWAAYLEEIRDAEESMFEEQGAALVVTLGAALGNLAVAS
jgi:hypothetical protein